MARENKFQANLIKRLFDEFPGCMVLKNDANYIQGIPDLMILYRKHWAVLECKRSMSEVLDPNAHEPNQDYYVDRMNQMSFGRFICPENQEEVIDELHRSFKTYRPTRLPKCK